ncbi:SAM domain (Sterile alpha motif) domain containing protein [Balamuthia mandrillaris]
MGESEDQQTLLNLVKGVASRANRGEGEVARVCQVLKAHWISSLAHWHALSPSRKQEVPIPALLKQEMDGTKAQTTPSSSPPSSAPSGGRSSQRKRRSPPSRPLLTDFVPNYYCYISYNDAGNSSTKKKKKQPRPSLGAMEPSVLCCEIEGVLYTFDSEEPLSKLLRAVKTKEGTIEALLLTKGNKAIINTATKLRHALCPGSLLVTDQRTYLVKENGPFKAIDNWLHSLGLERYNSLFLHHGIDDFLVLPFLRPSVLDQIGIFESEDKKILLRAVKLLQDMSDCEFVGTWISFLGFGKYQQNFVDNAVDLRAIALTSLTDLEALGFTSSEIAEDGVRLLDTIKYYREYSSAEATYQWLESRGLERYAYQFARYNIPFYALPLVNFFIIDEMGVTNDDKALLYALQTLRDSPCYSVKAMAFWLRDLELEHYSLVFARNLMVDFIESLTILNDHYINHLIPSPPDREKIKAAVQEMKEAQFYYSASASLLQELVMDKYAASFAKHGISIDVLPMLNECNLLEMGFYDPTDRATILSAVQKIKADLPSGALRLFYSNEPNLYQISHQELPSYRKFNTAAATAASAAYPMYSCPSSSTPLVSSPSPAAAAAVCPSHKSNYSSRSPISGSSSSAAKPQSLPRIEDTRSVEELLSFINGRSPPSSSETTGNQHRSRRSKSRKKQRARQKKAAATNQQSSSVSPPTSSSLQETKNQQLSSSPPLCASPPTKAQSCAKEFLLHNNNNIDNTINEKMKQDSKHYRKNNYDVPSPFPLPSSSIKSCCTGEQEERAQKNTSKNNKPQQQQSLKNKNNKPQKQSNNINANKTVVGEFNAEKATWKEDEGEEVEGEFEELDPDLQAQLDKEVEEFRRRLESMHRHSSKAQRAKLRSPFLSEMMALCSSSPPKCASSSAN